MEEKKALVQDLQNQLEKTMAKSRDARRDLEEKNTVIQDLINECSALRLQVKGRREHSLAHSLAYTLLHSLADPEFACSHTIHTVCSCMCNSNATCMPPFVCVTGFYACMHVRTCMCM